MRVAAAGICGSDLAINQGAFPSRLKLPRVLGHEWSGEIIEVGTEVKGLKSGDRVVSEEILWCGDCQYCKEGWKDYCEQPEELGFTVDGAFATHVRIPSQYCYKFADHISFEAAAMVEPLSVAYNALFLAGGGVRVGERVAVVGLGPIGLFVAQWLLAAGAIPVGFEPREFRRDLASRCGVAEIYCAPSEARLNNESDTQFDALVEASGDHEIVDLMLPLVRSKGRVILVGHSVKKVNISLEQVVLKGLSVVGTIGQVGRNSYPKVIEALSNGAVKASSIITHRFTLEEISSAFDLAKNSDGFGKIIISSQ
ncbi:MAG: alcohol dehydrogenase catalytic domain-containing protein [Pyrinomonadaceae bacterium]